MKSVGIVGFGNMGEAVAAGISRGDSAVDLLVMEPVAAKRERAQAEYGASIVENARDLFHNADISVIALKPQILDGVLRTLSTDSGGRRFVSVVAGVPISRFAKALGTDQVVRFMPNLAATVGMAVVAMAYGEEIEAETLGHAKRIAKVIGQPIVLPERLMSAVTGVSGSGIAYVFALAHAMALGGTKAGMSYHEALEAAVGAIRGAGDLLKEGSTHPVELLSRVTSAGGTTIEGVAELEAGGFNSAVIRAVVAAAERAVELETGDR